MDTKALVTFQTIVKQGSFIRAAQELNYAQSTITMQMQKLESDLGVQLLERGKELALTEAGRLFYDESALILKRMERLQSSLSDLQSGEAGHVRLGVTEPTASYRLPRLLGSFIDKYPNIRIAVEISSSAVLCEKILKGELDFALGTAPGIGNELYFEPLFHETFVVLLPDDHPLARQEEIDPEDLQGHRLLVTSATCPYRRKLEVVLQARGSVTLDTMEIGSMTALKHYVECGLGIALVPEIVVEPAAKGTVVRPIDVSLVHMTIGMSCKASAYPLQMASQRLFQYLARELSKTNE
ncbi:LysR family transcriptional regulator [Paenibacillus aurantiacus]|uniref:LysR family transcriptional regulator n=1 Tax=Paenibacillus aurantiacus TaxID=1936118 RepID=A0ABV5KRH7_9BACL